MNNIHPNGNVLGGAARGLGDVGMGQAIVGQRYAAEQSAQKVSEIQEQAERLEKSIVRMRECVAHLGQRLGPVLRPRPPEDAKNSAGPIGPGSQHAQFLSTCTSSVDALSTEMGDLLQRLAV